MISVSVCDSQYCERRRRMIDGRYCERLIVGRPVYDCVQCMIPTVFTLCASGRGARSNLSRAPRVAYEMSRVRARTSAYERHRTRSRTAQRRGTMRRG